MEALVVGGVVVVEDDEDLWTTRRRLDLTLGDARAIRHGEDGRRGGQGKGGREQEGKDEKDEEEGNVKWTRHRDERRGKAKRERRSRREESKRPTQTLVDGLIEVSAPHISRELDRLRRCGCDARVVQVLLDDQMLLSSSTEQVSNGVLERSD